MTIRSVFPQKEQVLTEDYRHFDNFFPIATVELNENGQVVLIPIIYTFLQGSSADERYFLEGEFGGSFSLYITGNYTKPAFETEALEISADYQEFLDEAKEKYKSAIKRYKSVPLQFVNKPDWWQGDDTPVDDAGNNLKFICQIELVDIVDDDCRMFVFYDAMGKRIKNVYQRD